MNVAMWLIVEDWTIHAAIIVAVVSGAVAGWFAGRAAERKKSEWWFKMDD